MELTLETGAHSIPTLLIPLTLTNLIVGVLADTTTKPRRTQLLEEFQLSLEGLFPEFSNFFRTLVPSVGSLPIATHELIVMFSNHQQEVAVGHGHMSDRKPPQREQVDGRTTSEFASDVGNRRYANPPSVEPPRNPLVSKVK